MLYVEDAIHDLLNTGFTLYDAEATRKAVAKQQPVFVHYRLLYLTRGGTVHRWHQIERSFKNGYLRMHHEAIRRRPSHDPNLCIMCQAEREWLATKQLHQ